jgi:AAA15 family ATPase/GTPase
MEMIRQLQINNYKSINQVDLDCRRINVLVGRPNVGKSNILEALDLFYLSKLLERNEPGKKTGHSPVNLKEYFRVKKVSDLFHLGDTSKKITVIHDAKDSYDLTLRFNNEENLFEWEKSNGQTTKFDNDFEPKANTTFYSSSIRPYKYKKDIELHETSDFNVLFPPFGDNLIEVIQHSPSFRELIGGLAEDNGFEFNVDTLSHNLLIQLRVGKGVVYSLPYQALADTLKRLVFYTAAIRYNATSVITLEEPEVHSFPPFVSFLGDEIINARKSQFFIATHSPYLLNNLIENTPSEELSVFVCGYNKSKLETTVRKLSEDELSELLNFGMDIFFNINRYAGTGKKDNS